MVNRFQAARELLGHDLDVKQRRINGTTTHYWVECSCGYKTEPGKSMRYHTSAAIGHAKRVADRLRAEAHDGVSFTESSGAALDDSSNVVIRASG